MANMIKPGWPAELRIGVLNTAVFNAVLQQDSRVSAIDEGSIFFVRKLRVLPDGVDSLSHWYLNRKSVMYSSVLDLVAKPSVQAALLERFVPSTSGQDPICETFTRLTRNFDLTIDIILGHRPLVERALQLIHDDAPIGIDPVLWIQQVAERTFAYKQ